ncbi:hypothetical protein UlMin_003984 [Ulmus minor]
MGKRKERRLAAKSNAGRRVKLDLFAEPSGDLGGSTVNDEVGAEKESKNGAGLPNSPSSSGQQVENPLLLLGQYSDDELEDGSNEKHDNVTEETSTPSNKDEAGALVEEGSKDVDVNADEDFATHKVQQQEMGKDYSSLGVSQNQDVTDRREIDATVSTKISKDLEAGQSFAPEASDLQSGDVGSVWQIVMHEESNQYYYWNTVTGETSWGVPEGLTQATELPGNGAPAVSERTDGVSVVPEEASLGLGVKTIEESANLIYAHGSQPVEWNGEMQVEAQTNWGNGVIISSTFNSTLSDGSSTDLSSSLTKHCEYLLERLKSLKGSKGKLQDIDWISKYILEVEIRLSDIKSLSYLGSSLHPFWVHSERELKRIEDSINSEMYKIATNEVEATTSLSMGDEKSQEIMEHESRTNETGNEVLFSTSGNFQVPPSGNLERVVSKDPDAKVSAVNASSIRHMESGSSEQVSETACRDDLSSKHGLDAGEDELGIHADEDVDMDVEMEVDEDNSAGNMGTAAASSATDFAAPEQPIQPIPPSEYASKVSDDAFTVPPPPGEEWIPPPPPDNEQIPPPPPDEPPEPFYPPPPAYPESEQPPPFTEQYNFSYPASSVGYYCHAVAEVPSGNLYGNVEGSQVAYPHAPIYYNAVPNMYTETPQITVNPIAPVAYYGLQDGVAAPGPVVSTVGSSQFHGESAPATNDTLPSDHVRPIDSSIEAGHNSLPTTSDKSSGSGDTEVLSTTATVQVPAVASVKENVSTASNIAVSSTTTASATSVVTKVQAKVSRGKKRSVAVAPSLRSNKKVSSLVDKWKAAKEELLEDEEEPENACEFLERKRQKEIEQWHAQQIASGEAKDNANFQPLGGDWRERVKRRRAQLAKETKQTSPKVHNEENQQPDATELSKDLPYGWKAYWDESSKQVYYGNSVTSETTWTKPTK